MEKLVAEVPELAKSLEGWYSPGIRVGNLVFLSGLAGKNRATGQILPSVEDQIRQIFADMSTILAAHGAQLSDVVKMTMYFTNRKRDWPAFDRIRRELFLSRPPCTIGVGVTEIALGADIAIDSIAVVT
jgi:2-iminobutanoate/2-iminopropanoate deaminase